MRAWTRRATRGGSYPPQNESGCFEAIAMMTSASMMPGGLAGSESLGSVVSVGRPCFGSAEAFGYLPDRPNMRNTDALLS
jgi:hypothetical protein